MDSNVASAARVRALWALSATLVLVLTSACVQTRSTTAPTTATTTSATPTVASITVGVAGNAAPVLAPGSMLQLWAVANYTDKSSRDVTNTATWQSSNPAIATLSRDGVLTAAAEGAVDVVAAVERISGSLRATIQRPACKDSTLSSPALTFNAFDHFVNLKLTTPQADCRWIAKTDADWIRFNGTPGATFDPGQSGSGSLSYAVLANSHPDIRTGHVTISFTDGSQLVHSVDQEHPVSCSYVVTPEDGHFRAAGGTGSFDLSTTPRDCKWTATAVNGFYGIRLTSSASGTGAAHVTYIVGQTSVGYAKEASISIAGLSGVNPPGTHRIHIAAQ
jgi:hypothetical protein